MSAVSTLDFLKIVVDNPSLGEEDLVMLWRRGVIEEYDILNKNNPIDRKSAARIVHQYMLIEKRVSDIEDISSASQLRDLYDCRICVNHIAQVFLRNIMSGIEIPGLSDARFLIFDSKKEVSTEEAKSIKEKLLTI